VTFNLLQMLDTLERFTTVPVGPVRLRMDPHEAPVLEPYARAIVNAALPRYGARYGLEPRGPILVEIFPTHDHFAVRTLGVPGLLGALGACFGRVVTQDSPRARPPNTFNWQATLWHELAHVFTLQLSAYRVPRWLSEGISVYEEGRVRTEWAGDSELTFAEVYAKDQAPKLADFDAAFTRHDLVAAAYFQASLVVGLIVERHGEAALRRLVAAYASGGTTDDALRLATGMSIGDLQAAVDAALESRYRAAARALAPPRGFTLPPQATPAVLTELAGRFAGSYRAQLAIGDALAAAGARTEALEAFERAQQLVPFARGPSSPRARIADVALAAGDTDRALRVLASLVGEDHDNTDAARQLAMLATKAGNDDLRELAYERVVTADPFDAAAHTAYGRLARQKGRLDVAVREFQAAVAAGPSDPAVAQCDLGEAYLDAGRRTEAHRAAVAALEIAPTFERAQDLLLRTQKDDH
jgi:cellulose synthase operon protein C